MSLTDYLASKKSAPKTVVPVRQKSDRKPAEQLHVHDLVVKYVRENRAGVDKQLNWTYRPANLIAVENLGVLTG